MRVLHIAPGNLYGGVETLLVTLARCRDLCPSMEPEFAVCFEGRLSEELEAAGVPVHRLGAVRTRQPLSVWRARRKLDELLRLGTFDVVLCHMQWPQAIFGSTVRAAGVPLAFWLHMATDGRGWLNRWAARTRPDIAICPSEFVAAKLPNIYPGLRCEVVHYAIVSQGNVAGAETRLATRAELGVPDRNVVVIQACRMESWKGQSICLEALGMLRDLTGWECWQVGGPQRPKEYEYFESLKHLSSRLGIAPRVRFFGQRSDVASLLAAAEIYCQPNTGLEGLPIVFGEALYAGLPIVTSKLGGFWELVDASCGILVAPGDVTALAEALRRLIEDTDLRTKLGGNGPRVAHKFFGPSSQIPKLGYLLAEITRSPSRLATGTTS